MWGPDELIEAGDVIVIQAVVVEDAANPLFALYGGEHAFPYETLFEDAFSTLTADFTSIVEGAVGVVPNCVFNLTKNSNDLSDTDPGDEIQVTWFYKIGSENLVGGAGVRSVELVARDPSGNITREEVPVGEVDFAEPEVDIRAFAISIPRVVLQTLPSRLLEIIATLVPPMRMRSAQQPHQPAQP